MRTFEEYLQEGIVRRQTSNRQRALSLLKESAKKKEFLEILLKKIPEKEMSPNFIVDQCYDILMELLRAKMFIDGFSAGNSHEAEVSYMLVIGLSHSDLKFMDELRYYRNGIKYYGTILSNEYAGRVLEFMSKLYPILKNMVK